MRSRQDSKYDIVAFVAWSNSIQSLCLCLCSYPYIIEGKVSSFSIALGMALASQTSAAFSLFPEELVWLFLNFIQCQFILSYVRGAQESRGRDWIRWSWSHRHTQSAQCGCWESAWVLHQSIICSLPLKPSLQKLLLLKQDQDHV